MHRLIVAALATTDALVAHAIGIVLALAPLTAVLALSLGADADWGALWPTSASLWHLANFVPLEVTLDTAALKLPDAAESFALTLAPMALAVFVVVFAFRSGRRAAASGAGLTGALAGVGASAAFAALVATTASGPLVHADTAPAIIGPTIVYGVPLIAGAASAMWSASDDNLLARLRVRWVGAAGAWADVPAAAGRGAGAALAAVGCFAGLAVVVALGFGWARAVTLFEQAHADAPGVIVTGLVQIAYVPNAVVWAAAWLSGPGFTVGEGTAVSPAGTDVGPIPGIPIFGLLPQDVPAGMLAVAVLPVVAGVLGGLIARSSLTRAGIIRPPAQDSHSDAHAAGPMLPRVVTAVAVAVLAGAAGAGLAALASGGIGPERMAQLGPDPGAVSFAMGLEVLLGAAIAVLGPSPRGRAALPPRR